jgi:hypothetical protein
MPKWVHTDVLDNGLNEVLNNTNQMSLVTGFAPGDAYAVVVARSVCDVAMTGGDFTLQNFGTNERELEVATKTATATAASPATPDLHIVLLDTAGQRVLAVCDETSDQAIASGNPITFPQWSLRGRQPV